MATFLSRLTFYVALGFSASLTIVLLGAAMNFGFGPALEAGFGYFLIVVVMLLNPVVFGLVGFLKGTPRSQLLAGAAMLILLLLYVAWVSGYFAG